MSLPPYSDSPTPTPFRSPIENDLPPSYDDITNPDGMFPLESLSKWPLPWLPSRMFEQMLIDNLIMFCGNCAHAKKDKIMYSTAS